MKKAIYLLIAIAVLTTTGQAQQKIAIINLKTVFDGYWKREKADANLKAQDKDFRDQKQKMLDQYQAANKEYGSLMERANDQALSSSKREELKGDAGKKFQEIKDIEQDIKDYDRSAKERLVETQKRLRDGIVREIRDLIDKKGKAEGYSLILDIAAEGMNQTPVVLFTDGSHDITDEILTQLNAGAPTDAPK